MPHSRISVQHIYEVGENMVKIHGIGASDGMIMGQLVLYQPDKVKVEKHAVEDVENEVQRLKEAQKEAVNSLNKVYLQSLKRLGEKDSMIFQIHMMMLQDEDYTNSILDKIRQENVNAEYAVQETGKEFAERFAQMDSEYMRGRKADVIDISRRLIQCLAQKDGTKFCLDEPSIIAADDLTPSETMQLEKSKVLAILTRNGSRTAHSAILSRTMGIPSVVNLGDDFQKLRDGMNVIVNGTSGDVLLEPDEAAQNTYQQSREEYVRNRNELKQLLGKKIVTRDGRVMSVNANIGRPTDAEAALENGADGIGLFRSEFLYMERDSLPSEDEQFHAYQQVLQKMGDKPVIIRTFDIGADKQLPYLDLPQEQNPALGYRAIRICLDRTELFKTQLRALFRASAFGNLKIMFPMIISVEEVRKAKAMIEEVKAELSKEKIAFAPDVKIGIMVETPAAAVLSDELAKECDFFSVGTNDLTQYTLAADRTNGKIAGIYNQRHPAVLKFLEMTAKNAHKAGIPFGICGESAADPELTSFYLKIGVDELSVAPPSILGLKKRALTMI